MLKVLTTFALLSAAPAMALDLTPPARPLASAILGMMRPAQGFDCSDRSCKSLSSCEEACHKLLVCGQAKRDGDNDGIPCENLCRRRC